MAWIKGLRPGPGAFAEVTMLKKTVLSMLVLATVAGGALSTASTAEAQYRQPRQDYGNWDQQPPPPQRHHHRHNNGGIIAGGIAAGVLGGIIGGALANGNDGGYAPPPPPQPRCWFEDRSVQNQYDDGWHQEQIRVCN